MNDHDYAQLLEDGTRMPYSITSRLPDYSTIEGRLMNRYARADIAGARFMQNSESALVAVEVAARLLERKVNEKLDQIDAFGRDEWDEGTIFRFDKTFVTDGRTYKYAAIKAAGLWYTTGPKSPKGFTWEEFVAWLVTGDIPVKPDELHLMQDATFHKD